jgi:hypothetical protein
MYSYVRVPLRGEHFAAVLEDTLAIGAVAPIVKFV